MNAEEISRLIEKSFEVKEKAYCCYSRFPVGAALLCDDGTIFTGCNVENSVNNLGICAERTAIFKAVSEGYRHFKAVAVTSDLTSTIITPCGACRQVMAEFGLDLDVYMTKSDHSYELRKLADLLPLSFGPSALEEVTGKTIGC